jgi:hypothetical protein
MNRPELMVTLWPSFVHFARFATDQRLSGIRLNSAMTRASELDAEFELAAKTPDALPLWFDIKSRQMRIAEVDPRTDHLEIILNHAISVKTPTPVLFKAGADDALLEEVKDGGRHLVFRGGPRFNVIPGESLHIRAPDLVVQGPIFTDAELAKIEKVKAAGIGKWFLSYVEAQSDVDQFLELVGADAEVMLKIESPRGLRYVERDFRKTPNLTLVAARGDLYVEIDRPHQIHAALRLIVEKDPEALVGSRLLLSTIRSPVPECSDFLELAWLIDIGYKRMMLCDELCLKADLLSRAIGAFDEFRRDYRPRRKR